MRNASVTYQPMKLFAKLMITLLVIAMLLPFTILKGPDGNTLMSFSDLSLPSFSLPDMPKMPSAGDLAPSAGNLSGKDVFYQWYDADGNVQFTTDPPPDGVEYTRKGYDPNANVIQAVEPLPEKGDEAAEVTEIKPPEDDIGNPYSQEAIEKLFKDAQNIEKMLSEKLKQQEAIANQ